MIEESKNQILKFQDIKLITSKNRHRFVAPGGVKKLTKEEFEAFRNQVTRSRSYETNIYSVFFRFKDKHAIFFEPTITSMKPI